MRMNMKDEREPGGGKLAEGWYKFKVINVVEQTSKKGNKMFVWSLQEEETGKDETVYAVAEHKKRWFLKQMLTACDVCVEDGEEYVFELEDLIGSFIGGRVEHYKDKWINNEGKEIEVTKAKIVEFQSEIPF